MSKKVEKPDEPDPGIPAWIVSFSDMVTLLLAFFVLLQSFAKPIDPNKFNLGRGAFRRAISGLGLPSWLTSQASRMDMDQVAPKNPMEEDENANEESVKDADDDRIRDFFNRVREDLKTEVDDSRQRMIDIGATRVKFAKGRWDLDQTAKSLLDKRLNSFQMLSPQKRIRIYVVGLAGDVGGGPRKWLVSARRAEAAANYLRKRLATNISQGKWQIHTWGEGDGGQWSKARQIDARHTSIALATMEITQ